MIWTAFLLGFAGSLHCIGMCSPLAMVVTTKALVNRLLYNMGRIFTYGAMGAMVASVGFALPVSKYQNLLSLAFGLLLIGAGMKNISHIRVEFGHRVLSKVNLALKNLFAHYLKKRTPTTTFFLGVLNGSLPCGLTFLALTYCVILSTPVKGLSFMLFFGAGTLPALLGFHGLFYWIIKQYHISLQRITTSLFMIAGALLVIRVFLIHLSHANSVGSGIIDIVTCGK